MAWSVLVTGSNRGIGLALVKYLLNHADPPKILIAACRNPDEAKELQELKSKNKNLHLLQLDVSKFDSFSDVANKVESIVGQNGLNVLLNNAGIGTNTKYHGFGNLKPEDYQRVYNTNTIGPVFLTKALLPLIERAAAANKDKPEGIKRAAILNMSSLLGSINLNFGKFHAYRESKAALNMFSRSIAAELEPQGIVVTVLHPGHVRTELGGPEGQLSVDESVSGLTNVFYSIDKSKHNKFLQWDGAELPW